MKQSRRQNSQDSSVKKQVGVKESIAAEENLKAMKAEDSETEVSADAKENVEAKDADVEATSSDDSDAFVASVSRITEGAADTVLVSAKETIEQATQAYKSARLAYEQAVGTYKSALETIAQTRSSAKDVLGKVRGNPKPFLQAIVPGAVGAFLLFEKTRDGYRARNEKHDVSSY